MNRSESSLSLFLQQWVDLARYTGLQARKREVSDPSNSAALECNITEDTNTDEASEQ